MKNSVFGESAVCSAQLYIDIKIVRVNLSLSHYFVSYFCTVWIMHTVTPSVSLLSYMYSFAPNAR
jgi:hypothetical protein